MAELRNGRGGRGRRTGESNDAREAGRHTRVASNVFLVHFVPPFKGFIVSTPLVAIIPLCLVATVPSRSAAWLLRSQRRNRHDIVRELKFATWPRGNRVSSVAGWRRRERLLRGARRGVVEDVEANRWQPIFDDQPVSSIGALAVAPSDPTSLGRHGRAVHPLEHLGGLGRL